MYLKGGDYRLLNSILLLGQSELLIYFRLENSAGEICEEAVGSDLRTKKGGHCKDQEIRFSLPSAKSGLDWVIQLLFCLCLLSLSL